MKNMQNNKGFTLAELVIAIAILAIAITPLLANFIESGKMNKKSRDSMDATNMAQDFLEGASSYTAPEFIALFESEESLNHKILPGTLTYQSHGDCVTIGGVKSIYEADCSSFKTDNTIGQRHYSDKVVNGITSYKDVKKCNDYYLFLHAVNMGTKSYDYEMTLTTDYDNHNKKEVAHVSNIDKAFDVTYSINQNEYTQALDLLHDNSSMGSLLDYSKFNNNVDRNVTVNIKNKGTAGAPDYIVEVFSDYTVRDGALAGLGLTPEKKTVRPRAGANVSTLKSNQMPRSIYLYYEGMQGSTMADNKDHFEINNNTENPVTVYLIRNQVTDDSLYNTNYGTQVSIHSKNKDGSDNTLTDIVSNIRFDLSAELKNNVRIYKEGGSLIVLPDLTADQITNSKYKAARCTYLYNNAAVDETLYEKNFSDGYQKENKDFIYQLQLDVYELIGYSGDRKLVSQFTGSLSD